MTSTTNTPATLYAIGDVQGCQSRLASLLEQLDAGGEQPGVVFVGDLVNRGPQSLATVRTVRAMGERANVVLGNHDLHLLAAAHGIRKPSLSDTFAEILAAPDRDDILEWLRHQPLARMHNRHLLVHAGVLPQWSAEQTLALAAEVEAVLRGPDWIDFLRNMYGNEPAMWSDDLRGMDRLRCIVNALTRIRYCTPDGTMDFSTKESDGPGAAALLPWFEVPGRKTADITVVFGHWSALGLVMRANLIGLDTGCVWGGKLTAVRLADRALVQVDCPQYRKPG
jgi:bis(5'-nucleosyl)-tetraphosphatase (symmetrical)